MAYFVWFNREAVGVPFSADDMMNLAEHWLHPGRMLYGNFLLWHDYYRPLGGLFYVPLFQLWGLHPAPFHIALLVLVLLYIGLVYRLARVLGAGALESWVAALIMAYHAGLANLYYETSHIYDVLCAIFYAVTLLVYVRSRAEGRAVRNVEMAGFFAFFLCALNSKEMAVTLPVMLVAYECLYHMDAVRAGPGHWRRWPGYAVVGSGILTAIAIYGRVLTGIIHSQGYTATYSVGRFLEFQRQQFQDLFLQWHAEGWSLLLAAWIAATYWAWRSRRPLLRFCWVLVVVAPLPVAFLEGRGMAVFAIPLIGWAILAATAAVALSRAVAQGIGGDPGFRRLSPEMRLGIVLTVLLGTWAAWNRGIYERDVRKEMWDIRQPTAQVIRQFEVLQPRVPPHSTVVFLNDPFDGWDMAFIAELWFRDRSVTVRLQKKTPLPPEELSKAYRFDWRDGKLVEVGPPSR